MAFHEIGMVPEAGGGFVEGRPYQREGGLVMAMRSILSPTLFAWVAACVHATVGSAADGPDVVSEGHWDWIPAGALEVGYPAGPALVIESVIGHWNDADHDSDPLRGCFGRITAGIDGGKLDLGVGSKDRYSLPYASYDISLSYYKQYKPSFGINGSSQYVGVTLGGGAAITYGQAGYLRRLGSRHDPENVFFVSLGFGL